MTSTLDGQWPAERFVSRVVTPGDSRLLVEFIRERPSLKRSLKRALNAVGYDTTDWVRVVMYRDTFAFVQALGPAALDVLEISAGPQWRTRFPFRSFTPTTYPDFDICTDTLRRRFDLIIGDQVFEHLRRPAQAARNVYAMLKPGGHFIVATPFLVRVHKSPIDCTRWTETGLFCLLEEAGFPADLIRTKAWGNRACIKANLEHWRKRGFFGSLKNEPEFPVMVWAFAQKRDDNCNEKA
jgi:SAM-dependent methyltransferase